MAWLQERATAAGWCGPAIDTPDQCNDRAPASVCSTWEEMPGGAAAAGHLPHIPGYTCNAGGTRLPLGPEVEVWVWEAAAFGFA